MRWQLQWRWCYLLLIEFDLFISSYSHTDHPNPHCTRPLDPPLPPLFSNFPYFALNTSPASHQHMIFPNDDLSSPFTLITYLDPALLSSLYPTFQCIPPPHHPVRDSWIRQSPVGGKRDRKSMSGEGRDGKCITIQGGRGRGWAVWGNKRRMR